MLYLQIKPSATGIEHNGRAERELCVRQIIRCLKRYVAREVYPLLQVPLAD